MIPDGNQPNNDPPSEPKNAPSVDTASLQEEVVDVDSTLSQANFLKMRGQLDEAEKLCLKVLNIAPNNWDSLTLLGDIAAEQGALESGLHWYGLALESNSGSNGIILKRNRIQARIKERDSNEAITAAKRYGSRWPSWVLIFESVALIVILAVLAYAVGKRTNGQNQAILQPIETPQVNSMTLNRPPAATNNPPHQVIEQPSTDNLVVASATEDPNLSGLFNLHRPEILSLTYSAFDPRNNSATLEGKLPTGMDAKDYANAIAHDVFESVSIVNLVTIRVFEGSQLVFIADSNRQLFTASNAQSSSQEPVSSNSQSPSTLPNILTSVWQPNPASKPSGDTNPQSSEASGP